MRDRRHSQRVSDHAGNTVPVEELIDPELLEDDMVDREYLREVFREPRKYLPPPRPRSARKGQEPPREPESVLARRSKLVGLMLAGTLLSGSIVGAALIAEQRAETGGSGARGSNEIVGAAALGVFAAPTPAPGATPAVPPGPPSSAPPATSTATSSGKTAERAPGNAAAPPPSATNPGATSSAAVPAGRGDFGRLGPGDRIALVREFYRLVGSSPQDALELLTPELRADQPGELVRAWSSMESITLTDARLRGDGSVLAVVMMVQPDGEELRVTQLLNFADGTEPLISQARLLSAQHT